MAGSSSLGVVEGEKVGEKVGAKSGGRGGGMVSGRGGGRGRKTPVKDCDEGRQEERRKRA